VNFNLTYSSNQVICFQNKILVAVSGTANGGVWIYTDTLVGIKRTGNNISNKFSLKQNYPNPFNPSTKIKFEIPLSPLSERGVGGFVTLKIFDLLGREVAILVNEQLEPRTYEVEWSGTNYPSGVYFYKLVTDEFTESRRMVLLK
jgi:hypothetical protein